MSAALLLNSHMQLTKAVLLPVLVLFLAGFAQVASAANVVSLQSSAYSVSENDGNVAIVVQITPANHSDTVTVAYATTDGTAKKGTDYTQSNGTLTFGPNESAKLVQIPITDDLVSEGQEKFTLNLSTPNNATLGTSVATITINDNDGATTTIGFSPATYSVAENGGSVTLTVTRSDSIGTDRVDYTTAAGSATEAIDYQSVSGTLIFNDGETVKTISIAIFDDSLVEGDETFEVNLSSVGGDFSFTQSIATVTIVDNEASTVSFSNTSYQVAENGVNATVTLLRSGNTNSAVQVNITTVGGTASADRDYATVSRTVAFAQGETSATFDVPIFDDTEVEGTESFFIALSASPNSGVIVPGGTQNAEVSIIDNESANTVEFVSSNYTASEDTGTATITVRLNRVGDQNQIVTVQYFTDTGSATPGLDYTAISSSSNKKLTFNAGETLQTFPVTIINDSLVENTETVGLVLANPTGATLGSGAVSTLGIIDDDTAGTVQFSSGTYSVSESAGSVTLTVLLNRTGNTSSTVSVTYQTVAGSAGSSRFVPTSGTLTFASGSAVGTITVPVLNDTVVEPPQSFTVVLSNPVNATLGLPSSAEVALQDDDGLNTVEFDASDYGVVEISGAVQVRVKATRGADPNQVLTVNLALGAAGDTATNPADYQPPSSTVITFPAGVNVQDVTIPVTNNPLAQGVKTFTVALTNPGPFTSIGAQSTARVTIFDNSGPNTAQFLTSANRFREGDQLAIAVTVVRFGSFDVNGTSVNYTTELRSGDTAQEGVNFTKVAGTIFFAPLVQKINDVTVVVDNEHQKTIIIPIPNNTLIQGDVTFHLTLTTSDVAQLGSISSTQITITDDDLGNIVQFSSATYSITEAGGNVALTVNLIPNGDASKATSVNYSATPITAFSGFDFSPVSGTLTFAPGETLKTILVPINNDTIPEDPETFRVTLSNPSSGAIIGSPASSIVTIIDDDVRSTIQFSPTNYTVAENGGSVNLTLVANRQGSPDDVLTVHYSTTSNTALQGSDFIGKSDTLTFLAGETQKTINIPIINDSLIEGTESFFVTLSEPGIGVALGTNITATVDISDDDSPNATIGFNQSSFDVDEGAGFANLTVTRSGGLGVQATVNYSTGNGTAVSGINYVATTGSITFAVNEVAKVIQIPIIDDPTADPTLSFAVTLTAADGAGFVGGIGQATVNIIDNDATTFRFDPSTYSIDEGSGSVTLTVSALRVGDPADTVTVDYVTSDGTAKDGLNYTRTSGRLTFGPNVVSQTITVPIIDNSSTEGTTTFSVTLSNPLGGGDTGAPRLGTPSTAVVSIIDNDATTFQFASSSYTANSQAGAVNVVAVLSRIGDPNTTYSVSYATSDLTAVAGVNYTATSGTLTFAPGITTQIITVPLIAGPVGEPTRQFQITLSNPTNGAFLGTTATTTVTIVNPDLSTKPVNISTRGPVETGDGVMIAGFIVQGDSFKRVIVRGLGPSLTQSGVVGALQDPTLDLRDANGVQLVYNDDFRSSQEAEINSTGLAPSDDREAAIVATLVPGSYTAILRGKANGVGLVEVYDLESTSSTHLVNISTRAKVGMDDNGALIGGFIIDGQVAQQLLIRAIGPSLSDNGVTGVLANPTLDLYRGSQLILSNDDWKNPDESNIRNTGLAPTNDKEAAILVTLDPGSYTAVIRGKNNATGIALVEVYQMP